MPRSVSGLSRSLNMTRRAVAFIVVVAAIVVSFWQSGRVYLKQERAIATAQQEIAEHEDAIAALTDEVNRWKDPSFVTAQARERLGWVMPGEIGYVVIGADGEPLSGGNELVTAGALPSNEHRTTWWERMAGSITTADDPIPATTSAPVVMLAPSPTPTPKR
ncbi:MAG TPA: septum formation initiator family protein [Propionibacteriaceae bacterium]|nr:septum formation initiator family protein [Propionibacteriaceae bacterium]